MSFHEGLHRRMGYHLATQKTKRKPKVICDKCGKTYPAKCNYCPYCGAKNQDKDKPWHWIY